MQQPAPRRARHLMDPNAPRRQTDPEDLERLRRVQRWVLSVLAGTTIVHLSVGLVIGALFIDDSQRVSQLGLCALGGVVGVCGVAAVRAIHRRAVASLWLALGVLPGLLGVVLVLS